MKFIEININKAKILDEVSLNSAYAGAKTSQDDKAFERVATVEADSQLLSRFWAEICSEVIEKFRVFIVKSEKNDNIFSFTLELSNAYDESLTPSVEEDIFSATVKGVMAMWFRFTFSERSAEWRQEAASLLGRAFSKLCCRRRPTREK